MIEDYIVESLEGYIIEKNIVPLGRDALLLFLVIQDDIGQRYTYNISKSIEMNGIQDPKNKRARDIAWEVIVGDRVLIKKDIFNKSFYDFKILESGVNY